jgi:hypothetical protein
MANAWHTPRYHLCMKRCPHKEQFGHDVHATFEHTCNSYTNYEDHYVKEPDQCHLTRLVLRYFSNCNDTNNVQNHSLMVVVNVMLTAPRRSMPVRPDELSRSMPEAWTEIPECNR